MADPQPPQPPDSGNVDPLLESLLAKARPILAEERGLNHRSRVKIETLGKKMKVPAAVIEQAMQLLHGSPPVQGIGNKSTETQYEKAFAKTMAQKIASIPGKILTKKIEEKAISVGTRKYQLSETQARNIIRRVAEEVGVPRVTLTEAERHIEQEIAEAIGDATWVTGEVKARLIRNAKRLGVTSDQATSMIQRHLQFNFKQVQFERKLTDRLWVVAACIVVGTGVSLFVYFQMQKAKKENEAITERKEKEKKKLDEDVELSPKVPKTPDWWDDALKLQLQKTRLRVSGFPEIHEQLKSRNEVTRSRAYEAIFSLGQGKVNPQVIRQRIAVVIPGLYRTDPKIDALAGMIRGFGKSIRMPVGKVASSKDFFTKAFWALELLNQMVGEESLEDQKVVAIQTLIESITGRNFDLFLSTQARLKKQKRALIEVYFKQLADVGNAFPKTAPESFELLEEMAADELSADRIQNMRTLFLTAMLRDDAQWAQCSGLIKRTILQSSSGEISFFVDLMESTKNEPLQIFLEEALLERAGLGDDFDSIAELAARLREYFEIGKPKKAEEAMVSMESIDQVLQRYYNNWVTVPTEIDNRRSAQLLADSVYVATLVVILETDQEDSLDRLVSLGFPNLDDPDYLAKATGEVTDEDDPSGASDASTSGNSKSGDGSQRLLRQRMNEALTQMNRFQILAPERRIAILNRVRGLAPMLEQLEGPQAAILAKYLFARKTPQERASLPGVLPEFRKWPRLFLALSDLLDDNKLPQQTCLDIASLLLNEDLRIAGPQWNEQLAGKLNDAAREQLLIRSASAIEKGRPDPVGNLKSIMEYFYRLRVRALLTTEKLPSDSSLNGSFDFLIDQQFRKLQKAKDAEAITELRRRREIALALGQDPLTRFQLHQQALLVGLGTGASDPGKQVDIVTKLDRIASSRFARIDSVVGQIAENEIRILLNYYLLKLN